MTIGQYGVLTLTQARQETMKKRADVLGGGDPLDKKKRALKGETIAILCDEYLNRYAKNRKRTWKDDSYRINKYILPHWGGRKIQSIKRSELSSFHADLGKKHLHTANRVLELLAKMFVLAMQWGYLNEGATNPARGIEHFKEKKRDRWVTHEELPRLAEAIDNEPNIYARSALWLYLLTGARKTEILRAKWENVNWSRRELCLPETKADRIHYIPLSKEALVLLEQIPRLDGNPYIIPGKAQGQHLVNIFKPWCRVRNAAGVGDIRLHDLRRTVGSWLAQSGNSLHLIGKVLNHSSQSTTAIYARFGQDQVRQALDDHGKKLMGIAGKRKSAEIVKVNS